MKPGKQLAKNIEAKEQKNSIRLQQHSTQVQELEVEEKVTLGQRLADSMAAKVGSWAFLIGQTGVLAGWVGLNLAPGVPHWDESPFILLNLVFSFASAYTAPIVLMSQNRQSDVDRKKNEYDHLVNRNAAQNIELLHEKMDNLHSQQLQQLTQIVREQQRCLNEMKSSVMPLIKQQQENLNEMKVSVLPTLQQQQSLNEIKLTDTNGNHYSIYLPFELNRQIMEKSKKSELQIGEQSQVVKSLET
ncbi:DUF1003 domain-containing protein [Chlorogloeopsis sp. ULAP01]|uniref:DUF1003 domain-containing protein n=1 Tax=Chlorogloeopsis sp. ULAP01 TaxID=3056483 RepID=UPI0025AB0333|nr:DUF1003 domain-containing protein [Chlorogloeopsis sp. ULAP01]MDM9384108.1 DUF1003 domain-containing protein [Chlorogloeopsis sp. ULAP01]